MNKNTTNNYHWSKRIISGAAFKYGLPILICLWGLLFLTPLAFFTFFEVRLTPTIIVMNMLMPLTVIFKFYWNYYFFCNKWLNTHCGLRFWGINISISILLALFIQIAVHIIFGDLVSINVHTFYFARDVINMTMSGGIAIAIRLVLYYQRQEYEKEMVHKEAELRTIKKDISPHFLLNTLNNIYALTTFDTKRAQEAIIQLSQMLRTLLYTDTNQPTALVDSVNFMKCYVELMQLRTASNVKINVDIDIPKDKKIMIAQMLIVPLVENAFKHGIHPVKPSFINISVHANEKQVNIRVENSNFPKDDNDKSGHGIGLHQELSRLNLLYPNHYEWTKGTNEDKTVYTSNLTIYL